MGYKRINLPFEYDAFEPYIDKETMEIHYEGHHKGYMDNLNKAIDGTNICDTYPNLINLLKNYQKIENPETRVAIREFGGGLANHNFFFESLSKDKEIDYSLEIFKVINENWGSLENFKKEVEDQVKSLFGSGWVWFVKRKNNSLKIIKTFNQDNPWFLGFYPLFGIDLWEHAYYLKNKNKRLNYFEDFWKIINWEFVNEKFLDKNED